MLQSYFTNSFKVLEKASANANEMYLFVGSAGLHGTIIPLDIIFAEHFVQELGWNHVVTLQDRIVAKSLFKAAVNPATGRPDLRRTAFSKYRRLSRRESRRLSQRTLQAGHCWRIHGLR